MGLPLDEQYAELAELAGSFIHEIKNHLSTLGLNLQLLAEDFQEPETHRERRALERTLRLQHECQRLVDLANDFLRFARLKDLQLEPTNLAAIVEEMVDFFGPTARQANIEIKCYLPADLPAVLLDQELFKQALLNLMLNGQQAMPKGGELTIQAETIAEPFIPDCGPCRPADEAGTREKRPADEAGTREKRPADEAGTREKKMADEAGTREKKMADEAGTREKKMANSDPPSAIRHPPLKQSAIELSLIDTGKGIPPEVLPKVFRPFYSTKPGGSGLGLPTTRKIILAHGGTIDVQSELGRGTKFTIRLPTTEAISMGARA